MDTGERGRRSLDEEGEQLVNEQVKTIWHVFEVRRGPPLTGAVDLRARHVSTETENRIPAVSEVSFPGRGKGKSEQWHPKLVSSRDNF